MFVVLATGFDVVGMNSTSFPVDATHVSTFYGPKHRYNKYWHLVLLLVLASIFGGIHCAGWNFSFPSHAYRMLWRVASLSVTILPLVAISIVIVATILDKCGLCDAETLNATSGLMISFIMLMYAAARLMLLGQAIVLLRHLAPSALTAIDWAQFYPHFF